MAHYAAEPNSPFFLPIKAGPCAYHAGRVPARRTKRLPTVFLLGMVGFVIAAWCLINPDTVCSSGAR